MTIHDTTSVQIEAEALVHMVAIPTPLLSSPLGSYWKHLLCDFSLGGGRSSTKES